MSSHVQESLFPISEIRPELPFELGNHVVALTELQIVGDITQLPTEVDTLHIRQANGVPHVALLERFRQADGTIRSSGEYSIITAPRDV